MFQHYLFFVIKEHVFTFPSSRTKKLPETFYLLKYFQFQKKLKPGNKLINILQAGESRDRNQEGRAFWAPVHTNPGAQPASYTMGMCHSWG